MEQNQEQTPQETPEQKYERLYTQQAQAQTQTQEQLMAELQAMRQELAGLKQPQQPQTPETPQLSPAGNAQWVEKIRQGDFEGAQRIIIEETLRGVRPQLEQVKQEAYQQALSATQAHLEVDKYLSKIRTENPDLIQFERYLTAPVEQRVQAARDAGKIKSNADFMREYKAAVDAEVAEIRNLGLQFRADGKREALTRNREVISSTPLQPQQVQQQAPSQPDAPAETTDDYFARRRAEEARRRGLSL